MGRPSTLSRIKMTSLWADIVDTYDHHLIDLVGTFAIQVVFWWIPCTVFVLLDYLAPSFAERHKIQPIPKQPTFSEFARDFTISVLAREALFYYSHRLFHWRPLYQRIHKVHHRFTAPISFSSQYAHPLEHIFANTLPIVLPPMLLQTHVVTMWVFLAWQLIETATVHSGFDFFGGAARKHDRHHERFSVYFGGIGLLDWVHGTDEKRRKGSKAE